MTKMIAPNGATVNVSEEKAGRLLALGFKAPGDKQAADSKSPYASMKVDELRTEIESRNEGREEADLLPLEGKKADLVATLDADDASDDE